MAPSGSSNWDGVILGRLSSVAYPPSACDPVGSNLRGAALGLLLGFGLEHAADIEYRQRDLQRDQRKGAVMHTPQDPQDIAGEEHPEAGAAPLLAVGADQPCRE